MRLTDYTILEGHLDKDSKAIDAAGQPHEADVIHVNAEKLTFSIVRFHKPWVEEIIRQADAGKATITLAEELSLQGQKFPQGTKLSVELLETIQKNHLTSRANNSDVRTDALRCRLN